jgi:hypothetical protein
MMQSSVPLSSANPSSAGLAPLITLVGVRCWKERLAEIRDLLASGPRAGQALRQRHCIELSLDKLRRNPGARLSVTEALLGQIAAEIPLIATELTQPGRDRLIERLQLGLSGQNTLIPVFHLIRTALLQRDPDLQIWLAAHPGRYLLKMTLSNGLRGGLDASSADHETLSRLHQRITTMLRSSTRHDHDEAIVLRLDPLLLAGAQAEDNGLISSLRREFGPEAHLSVTTAGNGIFVMAARAGQENEVAIALRRRLAELAPARLTGERPGILSIFVEDTDRLEWRGLRDRLELEGEARQFMTGLEARPVVAVSFVSRFELFGVAEPNAASGGELRFRNPSHPAAGSAALAPAVLSSL